MTGVMSNDEGDVMEDDDSNAKSVTSRLIPKPQPPANTKNIIGSNSNGMMTRTMIPAMDPNCSAAAPNEPNRGAWRPGFCALHLVPLFGAPKWRPWKN